jgi:hypothetical protein
MKVVNVIYASGVLKTFLDARASGASRERLTQLSADSLAELEAARRLVPGERPRLKLIICEKAI